MMRNLETSSLEKIRSRLTAMSEALAVIPALSVNEALARMSAFVDELASVDTLALEREGRFEEAADLYRSIADVFETAAQKVPEEDRQQVASLGDYWSLKAQRAGVTPEPTEEPTPQPLPHVEQHREPTIDHPSPKMGRQGLRFTTDKSRLSTAVKQAVDLMQPGEPQAGFGTKVRTRLPPEQVEGASSKQQQFPRKKTKSQ